MIESDGGAVISFRGAGEIFAQDVSARDLAADAFIFEAFTPAPSIVTCAGQGAVKIGDGPLTLRLEVEDPDPDERFLIRRSRRVSSAISKLALMEAGLSRLPTKTPKPSHWPKTLSGSTRLTCRRWMGKSSTSASP